MTVREIPVDEIEIIPGRNYRETFETEDLEESMHAVGLLHPIRVFLREDGRYELDSGERRLRAARNLGWDTIDSIIIQGLDKIEREMASIDENIVRRDLRGAALDRALSRRKELYLQKYPETAQYVAGGKSNGEGKQPKSFTEDTADKTGKSARTIERSVRRAERLSPTTMAAYERGDISQTQADILAGLEHEEQEDMLEQVVGKSVEATRKIVSGELHDPDPDPEVAPQPMEQLEELYMHGQKIVGILEALRDFDGLDDEFVESVLNLQGTLDDEFEAFAEAAGYGEAAPEESEETSPDEDIFPDEPPF